MAPLLHEIDPGPECPEIVRMIVEIPKNSGNKYEYDRALGVFRLDRTLYWPMHYPDDYGVHPGHGGRGRRPDGRAHAGGSTQFPGLPDRSSPGRGRSEEHTSELQS